VLDLLGNGFVLLAGPDGQPWCDAAALVAEGLGLPLSAYLVAADGALVDAGSAFPEMFGTGADGAVLVRPDGVVAWRTTAAAEDPRTEVEQAMRLLLLR
jgi:putative polyketide hydroxylase